MGNNNPGKIRKEGREAFAPYCNPEDYCPYNGTGFWDMANKLDWMDGWKETEENWEIEQHRKADEEEEFTMMSSSCPWQYHTKQVSCKATANICSKDTCAIWSMIYFKS